MPCMKAESVTRDMITTKQVLSLVKLLHKKYLDIINQITKPNHRKHEGLSAKASANLNVNMYLKHLIKPHPGQEKPVSKRNGHDALNSVVEVI